MSSRIPYKLLHKPSATRPGPEIHGSLLASLKGIDTSNLPSSVDLRSQNVFPIYNQGSLGSCVVNATLASVQFLNTAFEGSRLDLYYYARVIDGTQNIDAGT